MEFINTKHGAEIYTNYDALILKGRILKRKMTQVGKDSIRCRNYFEYLSTYPYDFEGVQPYEGAGFVIGKLTGYFSIDTYYAGGPYYKCEVELFNHLWSKKGNPVRYCFVLISQSTGFFNDPDYDLLVDDGTVRGPVSKDHSDRGGSQIFAGTASLYSYFPHHDPDYMNYSDPQYWDEYFGNIEWRSGYPSDLEQWKNIAGATWYGYGYKPARSKNVGDAIYADSSTSTSRSVTLGSFWDGGYLKTKGACISTSINPTIADQVVYADDDEKTNFYKFSYYFNNLQPGTKYYIRTFYTRYGNTENGELETNEYTYYSDNTEFTTSSVLTPPKTMHAYASFISGTDAEFVFRFKIEGDKEILEAGICCATHESPTINDIKKTSVVRNINDYDTVKITGLTQNTTYYFASYAKTTDGIVYYTDYKVLQATDPWYASYTANMWMFKTLITTIPTAPVVNLKSIFKIIDTGAYVSGQMTSSGSSPVITRGICWATHNNPMISDSKDYDHSPRGEFDEYYVTLTGLQPSQKYYVRAYATNADGLTGYSSVYDLSTTDATVVSTYISTNKPAQITISSARTGGIISNNAGSAITARGVCYGTSQHPTTGGNKTTDGTGIGEFTSGLTGLAASTVYYVRAYFTNATGTVYGDEYQFTTPATIVIPEALTIVPVLGTNDVTLGINVINNGNGVVVNKIAYSTASIPSNVIPETAVAVDGGSGAHLLKILLSTLEDGQTYFVRAFAQNEAGFKACNEVTFTTPATQVVYIPALESLPIFQITKTGANVGGRITNFAQTGAIALEGVAYSTEHITGEGDPVESYEINGYNAESFSVNLNGLLSGTLYYIRAFAKNANGDVGWSEEQSFTTAVANGVLASVSIESLNEVSNNNFKIEIAVTGTGITEKGIVYSKNKLPDLSTGNRVVFDSFTDLLISFYEVTTYYIRAYAITAVGIAYSNQREIKVTSISDSFFGFYSNPTIGMIYPFKTRRWIWNGEGWERLITVNFDQTSDMVSKAVYENDLDDITKKILNAAKLDGDSNVITDTYVTKDELGDMPFALEPISLTYSDLYALKQANNLIVGQRYIINDYQTVHTIPNTEDINTGQVEALIVTALTNNKLAAECYSTLFPQDIIYYDIENNQSMVSGCTKGYIYRRIDTVNNNVIDMQPGQYLSDVVQTITGATFENPVTINFYNHSKTINWATFTGKIHWQRHVYLNFVGDINFWTDGYFPGIGFDEGMPLLTSKLFLGFSFSRENDDLFVLKSGLPADLKQIYFGGLDQGFQMVDDYATLIAYIDDYGNGDFGLVWAGGSRNDDAANATLYKKLSDNTLVDVTPEFSHCNLASYNLAHSYLFGAKLENANLGNANLVYANLEKANLVNANLGYANLEKANLVNADLGYAYLGYAYIGYAYLEKANLVYANLGNANLVNADLGYANLENIQVNTNSIFRGTNLQGATNLPASLNTKAKFIAVVGAGNVNAQTVWIDGTSILS